MNTLSVPLRRAVQAVASLGHHPNLVTPPDGPRGRLSQLAHAGTDFEGVWATSDIQGRLPKELRGTLLRNGPGTKSCGDKWFDNMFDGDALVTALRFDGSGRVIIRSRFIDTPERAREQAAGRMLYHAFGTRSRFGHTHKRVPSISLMALPDRLLAFSEADRPISLDPFDLSAHGPWDFGGTLPYGTSFTAHPKTDPKTGLIYAYGIEVMGPTLFFNPRLKVFRLDPAYGRLSVIGSVRLGAFTPIHDMLITEHHLVFVLCPVTIDLVRLLARSHTVADLIGYDAKQPLRIIVMRKDGSVPPIEMTSAPGAVIFHHVNAFETHGGRRIRFHSMVHEDATCYDVISAWSRPTAPALPRHWITRFDLDLINKTVIAREALSDGRPGDFPCIDGRKVSSAVRFLHALESDPRSDDPLSFDHLACWDLAMRRVKRLEAGRNRTFGEPVFVPHPDGDDENEGWLLMLGYDAARNETFLEVREAINLELKARVWLGRRLPLGIHGIFRPALR